LRSTEVTWMELGRLFQFPCDFSASPRVHPNRLLSQGF
jgi:hypothetical protein